MNIVCVGDNCIDDYKNLKVMYPGGNSLNVSAHVAILKEKAYYIGNIADDYMGKEIIRALEECHVDYSYSKIIKDSSTKYCDYDVIDGEKKFLQVVVKDNWANVVQLDTKLDVIKQADAVYTGVNSKIPEQVAKWEDIKCPLVYDFGEKEKYRTEEYIKPLGKLIDIALFSLIDDVCIEEFCKYIHSFGIKNIVMTKGDKGQYFSNGERIYHHDIKKVKAIDTMGAGDAFIAQFIISLIEDGYKTKERITNEEMINKALEKGSEYSALNCLKEGAFGIKVNY